MKALPIAPPIAPGQVWERRKDGALYEIVGFAGAFERYVDATTEINGKVRRRQLLESTLRSDYRLYGAEEEASDGTPK